MDSVSKGCLRVQIGSVARRVVIRAFLLAAVMSVVPLVHVFTGSYFELLAPIGLDGCAGKPGSNSTLTPSWYDFPGPIRRLVEPVQCGEDYANVTGIVVRELIEKKLMNFFNSSGLSGMRALCVGEGSGTAAEALRDLGLPGARGIDENRFFMLKRKQFVYEIDRDGSSFDLVLSGDLNAVSVPALVVLEIERVLVPGGIGAVLVGTSGSTTPNSLIRSATPISSVLKTSSIVHVTRVHNLTLVVFKKSIDNVGCFEQYRLPADCPSIINNRPFVAQMEPLLNSKPIDFEKKFTYLPKFSDLSSKKRFVYVDIGAGKHLNSNGTNWFPPNYPIDQKAFNVYFVDHNTSVMLSYVRKPGITFVYHPGLSGTEANETVSGDEDSEPYVGKTEFDFLGWFKETSQYADFVVLKMNAGKVEMKFLAELFESGAICYVDEMFLHCPGGSVEEGQGSAPVDCVDVLKDLRSNGVFVHQWWGDHDPTGIW